MWVDTEALTVHNVFKKPQEVRYGCNRLGVRSDVTKSATDCAEAHGPWLRSYLGWHHRHLSSGGYYPPEGGQDQACILESQLSKGQIPSTLLPTVVQPLNKYPRARKLSPFLTP